MWLKIILIRWWAARREWWAGRMKIRAIKRRNKRLQKAIKEANALTNWDRKTRYVFERGEQFDVFSTEQINFGKRTGRFSRGVTIRDIYEKACYTATFNPQVKDDWRRARNMEKERIEQKHKK